MTVGMMRAVVVNRDGHCKAPDLDPDAGPCFDRWGSPLRYDMDVEADYIEFGAKAPRHVLASDHVALCAGHHRGMGPQQGRVWATEKGRREQLRRYLDGLP